MNHCVPNKLHMGDIHVVLNCQGSARCITAEVCKSLNDKKNENNDRKICYFMHLSKSYKKGKFLEPICFPENVFYQGDQNRVVHCVSAAY